MLVLTRAENERIRIGDNIWLQVVKIRGNRVCIGIEASREVAIFREELLEKAMPPTSCGHTGHAEQATP
jgi:carbon storage regulator